MKIVSKWKRLDDAIREEPAKISGGKAKPRGCWKRHLVAEKLTKGRRKEASDASLLNQLIEIGLVDNL